MQRAMARSPRLFCWILPAIVIGLLCGAGGVCPSAAALPEGDVPDRLRDYDTQTAVDANQIDMFVTNEGSFAFDMWTGSAGLVFPKGTSKAAVFAAGIWVGARVNGQVRTSVAEYSCSYGPGRILPGGQPDDPMDPRYQVYKIAAGDDAGNPDYANWPAADGAPVGPQGEPRLIGDQTLWSVFNDLTRAMNNAASPVGIGLEVQNTTFAYDWIGAPETTVFLEWKIINKGSNYLEDAYVALWSDPDLGGAADDLVGCDPSRSIGYCYNATNADLKYGASPPAVGMQLVQGPIIPSPGDEAFVSGRIVPDHRNLPMTSFLKYINGTDPDSPETTYNYMQGRLADGSLIIDPVTGQVTTFMHSGDPVSGEGWLDTNPADRRMMLSSGPFTMAPGDTQIVAAAVVIGQGSDRLASVSVLKGNADLLPPLFRSAMGDGDGACCEPGGGCVVTNAAGCLGGGFRLGEGCDPSPCFLSSGACCFDNGTCLVLEPAGCTGHYQGDGSACSPGLCPVYGPAAACCTGPGGCQIMGEHECLTLGGTYLPGDVCDLMPPGEERGWQRNDRDHPMIDEIAGAGGVPVAPDGHGGPGNDLWHSRNSTGDWIMSAGGGSGGEDRFTRNGADVANLSYRDLILRWDERPNNVGWWAFDEGQAGPVPFGLYERDPYTGEETRLLPLLAGGGGTAGVYDYSEGTTDPYTGWPSTDWVYAYRLDSANASWREIVRDSQDGYIDDDPTTVELFARMILASPSQTLPAPGTVIQFSTNKPGILAGSGFDHAVPLAWPVPLGSITCVDVPMYDVYRNSVLVGTTALTSYVDTDSLSAGVTYTYEIRTRNPESGEVSAPSIGIPAVPDSGYSIASGRLSGVPQVDGVIGAREWNRATEINATFPPTGPRATVRVMNDGTFLYIALEDGVSADEFRIYVDANGNGVYDLDALEGMISLVQGVPHFTRLQGVYPAVEVVEEITNPSWMIGAAGASTAEIRLALDAGPLADRPDAAPVPFFFHSATGAATYPPGPPAVLAQAPRLFAGILLTGAPAGIEDEPAGVVFRTPVAYPNPFRSRTTIAYSVPTAQRVSVDVFDVTGKLVRRLAANARVEAAVQRTVWDGTDASGGAVPSGVYYLRVRGETIGFDRAVTLVR